MSEQNGMKIFVFLKFLMVKDFGEKKSDGELSFPFSSLMTLGPQNVIVLICTMADIRSQMLQHVFDFYLRPLVRETGFWEILQKS